MEGVKDEKSMGEFSSEVIADSVSQSPTKKTDGLEVSNLVAPVQESGPITIVQDGPVSTTPEESDVSSPVKAMIESSPGVSLDSVSESKDTIADNELEPSNLVASGEEIGLGTVVLDGSVGTSSSRESDVSSPVKMDEDPRTVGVESAAVEAIELETSSSLEGSFVENNVSIGLESGAFINNSLDKPGEAAQVAVASVGDVEVPSSILDVTTNKDSVANGSESNACSEIRDVSTSYGSETPIKQEAYEDKTHSTAKHQSATQQSKVVDMTADKSFSAPKAIAEVNQAKVYRALVDTAAPFESVKEAVSKFGGIVDWKAHKTQTMKRRELVQKELQKAQEEIPLYKKQTEEAEFKKGLVLKELQDTKRLIEELKLNLEKAQMEETQARQDSELVQLRVKEMEQGIAGEASVAIKAQVDVAKKRHAAAVAELESVRAELKALQEEHTALIIERDNAIKRAEEAVSASSNIEKTVEDLTLELISAREALEAAHTAHMEAEEHRIGAALARDQDMLTWEKELKQAEDELKQLNEKLLSMKDLQSKLDTASALLFNLKAELAAYMEAKLNEESENIKEDSTRSESVNGIKTHMDVQATIISVKKEIEEVKGNIEKAKEEVEILEVAAVSLKSELETEKAALASMQQREGMASIAVSSLEAEVSRIKAEIKAVQAKEKVARDQMLELPKTLQKASREAEEGKLAAQSAQEELRKVKEEEEQVKASSSTLQSRLIAALKEIEAAKVSERLALAAVKALQESEHATAMGRDDDANNWVTLPLDEYYALSKQAHDAEEEASERVAAAISQIEAAKESESNSLRSLEDELHELAKRKEALRLATEKAEHANEGKLAVEQELRKWRADNVQRRKANDASQATVNPSKSPQRSFEETKSFLVSQEDADLAQPTPSSTIYASENNADVKLRKKKSFLPRIVMFLARKKNQPSK